MSVVATRGERIARVTDPPAAAHSAPRLFEPQAGEVSLEDLILHAWEDLAGDQRAECPVCGGRMDAGAGCEGCGSELS